MIDHTQTATVPTTTTVVDAKRVVDTLIGIAVGDAFGSSLYHPDRRWINSNTIDFNNYYVGRVSVNPNEDSIWSYKGYKPGNYTDTTEMSLGLLNALIDSNFKIHDEDLLISKWREIFENNTKENGGVIRAGYGTIALYFTGKQDLTSIKASQANRKYPGNAPPMRAIPLGFLPASLESSISRFAQVNANATHPHPKAVASSIVVSWATHYLIIKAGDHNHIIDYCLDRLQHHSNKKDIDEETILYLTAVNQLGPQLQETDYVVLCGEQPTTSFPEGIFGLPSDAMRLAGTALYIIKYSRSAFEGLQKAVSMGGDVGTLAPVVVGILGGRHGLDDLPVGLLEGLENKSFIDAIGKKFVEKLMLFNVVV